MWKVEAQIIGHTDWLDVSDAIIKDFTFDLVIQDKNAELEQSACKITYSYDVLMSIDNLLDSAPHYIKITIEIGNTTKHFYFVPEEEDNFPKNKFNPKDRTLSFDYKGFSELDKLKSYSVDDIVWNMSFLYIQSLNGSQDNLFQQIIDVINDNRIFLNEIGPDADQMDWEFQIDGSSVSYWNISQGFFYEWPNLILLCPYLENLTFRDLLRDILLFNGGYVAIEDKDLTFKRISPESPNYVTLSNCLKYSYKRIKQVEKISINIHTCKGDGDEWTKREYVAPGPTYKNYYKIDFKFMGGARMTNTLDHLTQIGGDDNYQYLPDFVGVLTPHSLESTHYLRQLCHYTHRYFTEIVITCLLDENALSIRPNDVITSQELENLINVSFSSQCDCPIKKVEYNSNNTYQVTVLAPFINDY